MVRSPSGDIDILALFVAHDFSGVRIFIDNGTGKSRKIIDVTSSTLGFEKKELSLACIHFLAMTIYLASLEKVR